MYQRVCNWIIAVVFCLCIAGAIFVGVVFALDELKAESNSMFVTVEETARWEVVYHKETKVMYVFSRVGDNRGSFILLVDETGEPMIWSEN